MSGLRVDGCSLCGDAGGRLVWAGARLRVIHAGEADFPGFYRVVWSDHVAEFSGLSPADRALCMEAVAVVEQALLTHLAPTKINLAALGNMVPHLHWHVIARFDWDSRFPSPVWASAQRDANAARLAEVASMLPAAESAMIASLNARSF
jgi:diadenosine tetraphosphate (Ap4A) HIT family hydrolase